MTAVAAPTRSRSSLPGWLQMAILDMRTLVPTLRSAILLFILLPVMVWFGPFDAGMAITFGGVFSMVLVGTGLFTLDERANLDLLYGVLPVRTASFVIGRYVSVIAGQCAGMLMGAIIGYAIALARDTPVSDLAFTAMGSAAGIILLQALQLPFFFRVGATKARVVSMVVLFATLFAFTAFFQTGILNDAPTTSASDSEAVIWVVAALATATAFYAASALLSIRWYARREF